MIVLNKKSYANGVIVLMLAQVEDTFKVTALNLLKGEDRFREFDDVKEALTWFNTLVEGQDNYER